MITDLLKDADKKMDKSVEATRANFGTVRTGRASPALLDRVMGWDEMTALPVIGAPLLSDA